MATVSNPATGQMVELQQGLLMVGEFRAVKPGRRWSGKDGVERTPFNVVLIARDETRRIEYRDEASAVAAVGTTKRGEELVVGVFARAVGDRVYYSGVSRA